jgi:hypothetical protein
MRSRSAIVPCAAALIVAAMTAAQAQAPDPPGDRPTSTKRIELGAGLGGLLAPCPGLAISFPSARARVNVAPRFAVDVLTDFVLDREMGIHGFYSLMAHQTIGQPHGQGSSFATYGVLGRFEYFHEPERRFTWRSGDTVVYPAYRHGEVTKPLTVVAGGGYRVRLARRAFVEAGAQALLPLGDTFPIVAAFDVGIMVPVGR